MSCLDDSLIVTGVLASRNRYGCDKTVRQREINPFFA